MAYYKRMLRSHPAIATHQRPTDLTSRPTHQRPGPKGGMNKRERMGDPTADGCLFPPKPGASKRHCDRFSAPNNENIRVTVGFRL